MSAEAISTAEHAADVVEAFLQRRAEMRGNHPDDIVELDGGKYGLRVSDLRTLLDERRAVFEAEEVVRFSTFDGQDKPAYGGIVEDLTEVEWYRDGHPYVHRLVVDRFRKVSTEELPVDRTRARLESWATRNGRPISDGYDYDVHGPASDDEVPQA